MFWDVPTKLLKQKRSRFNLPNKCQGKPYPRLLAHSIQPEEVVSILPLLISESIKICTCMSPLGVPPTVLTSSVMAPMRRSVPVRMLFSALSFLHYRKDDDFVDRLSYFYTSSFLIMMAVLVSFKQVRSYPSLCSGRCSRISLFLRIFCEH